MALLDIAVLLFLLVGAIRGWKYGCFRSIVSLLGTILVFVLAFFLKNLVSGVFYENLPFQSYSGIFHGISSLNILLYEGLAYLICVVVLTIVLRVIISLTGILNKLVNMTIILNLPNKILGLILGVVEFYIYTFIFLFICAQLPITTKYFKEAEISQKIVSETPFISTVTNDIYHSVSEIYDICVGNEDNKDYKSLDVLMKYEVITPESVQKLVDKGKLKIANVDELIAKYEEKND